MVSVGSLVAWIIDWVFEMQGFTGDSGLLREIPGEKVCNNCNCRCRCEIHLLKKKIINIWLEIWMRRWLWQIFGERLWISPHGENRYLSKATTFSSNTVVRPFCVLILFLLSSNHSLRQNQHFTPASTVEAQTHTHTDHRSLINTQPAADSNRPIYPIMSQTAFHTPWMSLNTISMFFCYFNPGGSTFIPHKSWSCGLSHLWSLYQTNQSHLALAAGKFLFLHWTVTLDFFFNAVLTCKIKVFFTRMVKGCLALFKSSRRF